MIFIKKWGLQHRCFRVNVAKFLRTQKDSNCGNIITGIVDVDKNKKNTRCLGKMISYTTFEAQFITKLRNT